MTAQPFAGRFNRLIALARFGPNCSLDKISEADITTTEYIAADGSVLPGSLLYATDVDSLNLDLTEAADDCSPDSLWQILFASRANGLIKMEEDLLAAFDSLNTARLASFRGLIGQEEGIGYVKGLVDGQTVAVTLNPELLPGASLTITKIGLVVSADVDVQVSLPGLAGPITVVCSANTASYTTLPEPLVIPLDGKPKVFSYTVQGFRPRNNTLNCGCGGQQDRINQYFRGLVDTPAFGLLLGAEASCNKIEAVFTAYEDGGAVSRTLARTLLLITLANAIQRIITSGEISRFTMMETDQLYGKRNNYMKDYADRINWLAGPKGVDLTTTACYYGKTTESRVQKRGILS
jgi:hypothetical protein